MGNKSAAPASRRAGSGRPSDEHSLWLDNSPVADQRPSKGDMKAPPFETKAALAAAAAQRKRPVTVVDKWSAHIVLPDQAKGELAKFATWTQEPRTEQVSNLLLQTAWLLRFVIEQCTCIAGIYCLLVHPHCSSNAYRL